MSDQAVPQHVVNDDHPVILSDTRSEQEWVIIIQSTMGLMQIRMELKGTHLSAIDVVMARPCSRTTLVRENGLVKLDMPYKPLSISGKQAGHLLFNMRSELRKAKDQDLAGYFHDLGLTIKNRTAIERFGITSIQGEDSTRMPPPISRPRTARHYGRTTPGVVPRDFEPHQM